MTRAVAKIPERSPLNRTQSEATAIVQVIERAAFNPDVDIDKMERLLAMQERVMERAAKAAYIEALRTVKRLLPQIAQNGRIEIKARNAKEGDAPLQSTPYTRYEDIDAVVAPLLDAHGLVLSFRTSQAPDGRLIVTGVLSHSDGHEETTSLTLPYDSSGSKNGVQAVGSSLSYGKRYCAVALLNIVSQGEDDDGEIGGKLPSAHAAKQTEMGPRAADLANEIKGLESIGACVAWANARAAEISTFPKNWQDMLREDLKAQRAFIRDQEPREEWPEPEAGDDAETFHQDRSAAVAGRDDSFPGDRAA